MDLPPLPKPTFAAPTARDVERSSSATLAAEEPPQQKSTEKINTFHFTDTPGLSGLSQPSPDTFRRNGSGSSSLHRSSSKHPLDEIAESGQRSLNNMSTVHGESSASVLSALSARSTQEVSSLELVNNPPSADETVRESNDHLSVPLPTLTEWSNTASLRDWASLPHDEKMESFNDLVVQCISDNNFLVFAEDVYNNWRRVALGS